VLIDNNAEEIAGEVPQPAVSFEGGLHAAWAVDRLRRREAANSGHWARDCNATPRHGGFA